MKHPLYYFLRWAAYWARILDGLIGVCTLGCINTGLWIKVWDVWIRRLPK